MKPIEKIKKKYALLRLGSTFALFFLLVFFLSGRDVRILYASLAFLVLGLFVQPALGPLNRVWLGLGELMGRIVGSVFLGLLFFLFLTPLALLRRLFSKPGVDLKFRDGGTGSFWVAHKAGPIAPEDLEHTF